ncbi:MarR family transcriptional regulator [Streptomyces sp. enrichment culture]|uniref:MarR family transcriptional regulator n=1 Tax=Streptomyces sp. enrichment culture TaxID=1795815 RepID=UPI003F557851
MTLGRARPRFVTTGARIRSGYGACGINELAARLELAPTTVSLMVSELSQPGVLQRTADPADRPRIIAIAPAYAVPIGEWLPTAPLRTRRRHTSDAS